jgi:hypothetical protein
MHISLNPKRLRRYKDVARLLWRHGRADIVRKAGLEDSLRDEALSSDGAAV